MPKLPSSLVALSLESSLLRTFLKDSSLAALPLRTKDVDIPYFVQNFLLALLAYMESAATENILLMAHGLGLGGVWTALYPLKERYEGMQQLLHLPKTMIPLNTLIIGYPKNQVAAKDKWKEENISYNKWMEKNS